MKKNFLTAVVILLVIPLMQAWSPEKASEQKVVEDLKMTFRTETTEARETLNKECFPSVPPAA